MHKPANSPSNKGVTSTPPTREPHTHQGFRCSWRSCLAQRCTRSASDRDDMRRDQIRLCEASRLRTAVKACGAWNAEPEKGLCPFHPTRSPSTELMSSDSAIYVLVVENEFLADCMP